jgi:hypothetical protein
VEVGVLLVGLLGVGVVEPVVPLVDEPLEAGVGDTIATVEVGEGAVAVVDVGVDCEDEDPDDAEDDGLEANFGTALANGLRAMRASSTLGDSFFLVSTFCVVDVCAPAGEADGGAGTVGVELADALLSRNTGTAATATTSSATIIHSLRSTRSRRSELILVLRSSRRPEWPAGRWWL